MSLNITEIKETLEFNKEDLKGNRQLTNEMIVDDIMLGLGYNKRRDKSIQRLFDSLVDWIVTTNSGKKVAVKVLAYDEDIENTVEMDETMEYCLKTRFSLLLVITGLVLRVFRYDKKELEYTKVVDIRLDNELSESDISIINAISKETFDIDYIDSLLKPVFTQEDFISCLEDIRTDLVNYIIDSINVKLKTGVSCDTKMVDKFVNDAMSSLNGAHVNPEDNSELERLRAELYDAHEQLDHLGEINTSLEDKINELKTELANIDSDSTVSSDEVEQLSNALRDKDEEISSLREQLKSLNSSSEDIEQLSNTLRDKDTEIEQLNSQLEAKDEELNKQKELNEQLENDLQQLKNSQNTSKSSDSSSEELQKKIDSYVEQIRELSVKLSDATEEKEKVLQDLEDMKKEVEELSGSDLRFAERLLESADDDPDDERSYVAVINKEFLNYEDIHTFIGRCLQKLYDIKSFDASRYIFDGDIFELDKNARFADVVMGNNTYDIILKTNNENEELNKLRAIFSHFDDVTFVCKKIGTLRRDINSRYEIPEEKEEIQLESDDYIQDGSYGTDEQEMQLEDAFEMPTEMGEQTEDYEDNSDGLFEMPTDIGEESSEMSIEESSEMLTDGSEQSFEMPTEGSEQSFEMPTEDNLEQQIPYFDDGIDSTDNEVMGEYLLVGQLMNIDMLIWSEEKIKFNNIKYISTNIITFGINTSVESYDKLLCKCIDAILAIEAFNGSKNLINTLKQKDFSAVNNFIKVYSPEYAQYPRINGTRFVVVGIESVQQVAAALLDICNVMGISTEEIFLYFEAETNSQYIVENFSFDENAVRIAETTSYEPEEGVQPHDAIAIIKGDMFNNIVITKNSLKVHKEIFNRALAVKTKYLGMVIESNDKVYEIIGDIISAAHNENINIDYRLIGNVIGENYMLVSNSESRVSEDHVTIELGKEAIYISRIEDWQVPHSLIKVHTAIFNNTAIAVKSSVNADAINFYGQQFETSEPSLGLAVNSFVDYVASCVKE